MKKAIDEILKQYPFIMDEVRELQTRLNEYIALQAETRDTLRAMPVDKQPGGTDPSDQTYGAVEKLIDTYQAEIDLCVAKINELLDLFQFLIGRLKTDAGGAYYGEGGYISIPYR